MADKVGRDKQLYALAQDLIDNGQIEEIEKSEPELAKKIREAAQNGETVEVPVSTVLKIASTNPQLAQAISHDSRSSVDGMTPRQAEAFMQTGAKEAEAQFEKIIKRNKPTLELRKQAHEQAKAMQAQLEAEGIRPDVAKMMTLPHEAWLVNRSKQLGISPAELMKKINLRVKKQGAHNPNGSLSQPVTQGINWKMGVKYTDPNTQVRVVDIKKKQPLSYRALKEYLVKSMAKGIKNEDSGFVLTASGNDIDKWLQHRGAPSKQKVFLVSQMAENLGDLLANMKLVESHSDSKQHQKGIHNFVVGINFEGKTYRLSVTAKDFSSGKQDRVAAHAIGGTEVKAKIATISIKEVGKNPAAKRVVAAGGHVDLKGLGEHHQTIPVPLTTVRTVTLADLMGGVNPFLRADGKNYFDSVDANEYNEGGSYYSKEDVELKQSPVADSREGDEWLNWEPKKTKDGKIPGSPEWVINEQRLLEMRETLEQLALEGQMSRFWYENSAMAVMQLVNGNLKDADKFCQLIAIYSPTTEVGVNAGSAIMTYSHWKNGGSAETLHAQMKTMDKKAVDVLYHNKEWSGRKTNTFYLNLMYHIVAQNPEAARAAGIDVDEIMDGRATIDLWMLRAFGYNVAQASDDKVQGKYSFCENETRRLAAQLNAKLPEGAEPWTPHQVQAAIWTAIKTRHELKSVKEQTAKVDEQQGIKSTSSRAHNANWRRIAMQAPADVVIEEAKKSARSFADEFKRQTMILTWEAMPSTAFGYEIGNASAGAKRLFTNEVARIFLDENGENELAKALGLPLNFSAEGFGAYSSAISPNTLTHLAPPRKIGQTEIQKDQVRMFARSIQYVTLQDAVPFFRFENKPLSEKQLHDQRFKVIKDGATKAIKTFETQAEAEAYASKKGDGYKVIGGKYAKAVVIKCRNTLDENTLKSILGKLEERLGKGAGFTRTDVDEITIINFRSDDDHLPLLMSDEEFESAIEGLTLDDVIDISPTWTEGEYGYWHSWESDPDGSAILKLLGVENGNISRTVSGVEQNLGDGKSREGNESNAQSLEKQRLVRWRLHYEEILRKFSGEGLRQIEESLRGLEEVTSHSDENALYQSGVNTDSSWTPDADLIERAKKHFGVTKNAAEAFYILPDGTMLDGSGRHWGGDERDIADQRQVDHGDVSEIMQDATSFSGAMYEFMSSTGAMRVDFNNGVASHGERESAHKCAVQGRKPLEDAERQLCEVWTRVMGYHRPVSSSNIGKKVQRTQMLC